MEIDEAMYSVYILTDVSNDKTENKKFIEVKTYTSFVICGEIFTQRYFRKICGKCIFYYCIVFLILCWNLSRKGFVSYVFTEISIFKIKCRTNNQFLLIKIPSAFLFFILSSDKMFTSDFDFFINMRRIWKF